MKRIAILSPPASGNRFLKETLKRCGADAEIYHAPHVDNVKDYDFAVVLIRGIARWLDSNKRSNRFGAEERMPAKTHPYWLGHKGDPRGAHQANYAAIFSAIARHQKPFAVITYESLVSDSDDTMELLCEWMGIDWAGWPPPNGIDFNGPPVDGNAKYRNTLALSE